MFCRGFYVCPSVQSFLHTVCFRHNNDGSSNVVSMTVAVCHEIAETVHHILSCDIHVSTATLLRIWGGVKCYVFVDGWFPTFRSKFVPSLSRFEEFRRRCVLLRYKKIIKPIVVYGNETWTPSERVFTILATWEGEILRKIDGPICDRGMWRIRTNEKLYILISKHRHCNRR